MGDRMNVDYFAIGQRIKQVRRDRGMTQERLAEALSVSVGYISQIERGDYSPSVTLALKLAKICRVSVEDIFSYEEDGHDENQE